MLSGTAASRTVEFFECVSGIKKNLSLWRTLTGEFVAHTQKAKELLASEAPALDDVLVKLSTVAGIIAGMHKASHGDGGKQARLLAADALVQLDSFCQAVCGQSPVNAERLRDILRQDMIDRGGGLAQKRARRGKEDSSSART